MFHTGRIINPKTAASQFRGGIIMGIGAALTEEALFDERSGRVLNPSLAEYHVPVHADIPAIDVDWLDIPDPIASMGGKGVGMGRNRRELAHSRDLCFDFDGGIFNEVKYRFMVAFGGEAANRFEIERSTPLYPVQRTVRRMPRALMKSILPRR